MSTPFAYNSHWWLYSQDRFVKSWYALKLSLSMTPDPTTNFLEVSVCSAPVLFFSMDFWFWTLFVIITDHFKQFSLKYNFKVEKN